jgi:hypothetical protein
MTSRKLSNSLLFGALILLVSAAVPPSLHAQDLLASSPLPDSPTPFVTPAPPITTTPARLTPEHHKFWDKQNCALLLAAAALNGADFAVTRSNLQSGGQELNPVVRMFGRSDAGLAVNFIGETAGVISLSYFFHKTGHHKLERAVSLVNIGSSAGAVSYGLLHR